jgi:hypothetical protein
VAGIPPAASSLSPFPHLRIERIQGNGSNAAANEHVPPLEKQQEKHGEIDLMKRSIAIVSATIAAILFLAAVPSWRFGFACAGGGPINPSAPREPVLVELFTSEGCSDCPPADALLERLDRLQPVPGAETIVLSEHVDYWNHLGWQDPYSSHEFSVRQSAYAYRFRLDSVYTPQIVVDGESQMVGSDESNVLRGIAEAAAAPAIPVTLSGARREGGAILAHIEAGPAGQAAVKSPNVFVALADESDASSVSRGENAGRELIHVAVLRSLSDVGSLGRSGRFSGDVKLPYANENGGAVRVIVFLQEVPVGRVWAAAVARVSR